MCVSVGQLPGLRIMLRPACTVHEYIENHNSLGRKQPSGLDVKQSLNVQDPFRPIPGLISCAGVTGSVGITCHAHATQTAGPIVAVYTCVKTVTRCAGCIPASTRPHQLHWGDRECGHYASCMCSTDGWP